MMDIERKLFNKMGIRKDEMIQVTTFSKETIEKIQIKWNK